MKKNGFTFIELMIAVGLMGIFVPAIMKALSFSLMEARQGEQFSTAWALAREGMETVMSQKTSWAWTGADPANGTTTTVPKDSYTRATTITDAYRCNGTVICASGDPGAVPEGNTARVVTVTVTWPENNAVQKVELHAYVAKH